MKFTKTSIALRASSAVCVLGLALISAPSFAQTAPAAEKEDDQAIVVTGSILRRTDKETPSPVTVLSSEKLEARGINTVAEGLQRLSANGSGTLSEGWNNGNNFASGANAVSLRGLTVQKTLTVFDGLRMAPYPLADDGHRNFVDLSTIPDAIVDRTEILKDGASSTYGADAVAGVVNVITKKQVVGVHADVSAGISSRGDAGEKRADLTVGHGDLDTDGFNVYVSGMYRKNDALYARERGFPFNTGYLGGICDGAGHCMATPTRWYTFAVNPDGSLGGSSIPLAPLIAPANAAGTGKLAGTTYQLLNPNCGAFGSTPVTLPASAAGTTYNPSQCQADFKQLYGTFRPSTERYGFSGRATVKLGENAQAYVEGNFMHVNTYSQLSPGAFIDTTPPPSSVTLGALILPVYVCSAGVGTITNNSNVSTGCTAANGTLNPNNPFAATGQQAVVRGRYDRQRTDEANTRSLRVATGINGSIGSDQEWHYQVDFTASEVRLARIQENYMIPQRLADVVATGAYNFSQPWLNSQTVRDYIAPRSVNVSKSKLWQAQAVVQRELFELPGGKIQAAVGVSYRKESIYNPSANPDNVALPYNRYYTINAVGAVGSRNVKSAFYELNLPILDQLEVNASGRYDKYSSGQHNFSPKFGFKFSPLKEFTLRGTYSKGYRIPSFNEAFGLPTTGYTTLSINCTTYAAFCASHPDPLTGQPNTYVTNQYSLGRTSVGNPALKPEKSTSWTLGAIFEPVRNVSFTVDYFNIKVKDTIGNVSAADQTNALDAYLLNGITNGVPGVTVIPSLADAQNPAARPLPGFIAFSFQNADTEEVQGVDFGAEVQHDFGGFQFASSFEATYLIKYQIIRKDGSVERYDGSLSPCDYTSCSGSPKWRGTWSNTVSVGKLTLTGTAYYTHGYDLASVDYGGVKGDCAASIGASVVTYKGTTIPVKCKVGAQWNFDLTGTVKVNDNFKFYINALNIFDIGPKFDPSAAYSIFQYNPSWGSANMVGRYFRVGAKVDF